MTTMRNTSVLPRLEQLESRSMLAAASLVPLNQTFQLASLPSASKTIYLDFTGHVTSGAAATAWSSPSDIATPPFSIDTDPALSSTELTAIQRIWARVAEDFAPFSVNVTTREPVLADLVKSGPGDSRWGVRVVIGDGSGNPSPASGGIAILGSFNAAADVPCFVNTGTNQGENYVATVISHEVGHTLGLHHAGVNGAGEYYEGHGGAGPTGWGPIMGAPYGRSVTQWSTGQYANASSLIDELAVITGGNGFSYRPDDRSDTVAGARPLSRSSVDATLRGSGIIERNTDADMFSFVVGNGTFDVHVKPLDTLDATAFTGANLDVGLVIYSAAGQVVADVRPENRLDARFLGQLAGGTYFVKVFGTGNADPLVDGYTNYGSLGQYTVSVSPSPSSPADPPLISITAPATVVEGASGSRAVPFMVSLSKPASAAVTVRFNTRDGVATLLDGDYLSVNGTLTFAPGETRKTIMVSVVGDSRFEPAEDFSVELSNPTNASIGRGEASTTILNDDQLLATVIYASVAGPAGAVSEGGTAGFTITLSAPSTRSVQVGFVTVSRTATAGRDFAHTTGFVTFAPGETTKTVSVPTSDDSAPESDETFVLQLVRRPGAVLVGSFPAQATITDNDGGLAGGRVGSAALAAAFAGQSSGPTTAARKTQPVRT